VQLKHDYLFKLPYTFVRARDRTIAFQCRNMYNVIRDKEAHREEEWYAGFHPVAHRCLHERGDLKHDFGSWIDAGEMTVVLDRGMLIVSSTLAKARSSRT
jgi:hypothetical protein